MENPDTENDGGEKDDMTDSTSIGCPRTTDGEQRDCGQSSSEDKVSINGKLTDRGFPTSVPHELCSSSDSPSAAELGSRGRENCQAGSCPRDVVRMPPSDPGPQLQDPPSAAEPSSNVSTAAKKRRLHADAQDCLDLARSGPGADALKNPTAVVRSRTSQRDLAQCWLNPRPPRPSGSSPLSRSSQSPKALSPSRVRDRDGSPCTQAVSGKVVSRRDFHRRSPGPQAAMASGSTGFPKRNLIAYFAPRDTARQQVAQDGDHRTSGCMSTLSGQPSPQQGEQSAASSATGRNHVGLVHGPRSPASGQSAASHLGETPRSPGSSSLLQSPSGPCGLQSPAKHAHFAQHGPDGYHPSPAKSAASTTTESDIEDFQNDSSWDKLDFDDLALATPLGGPQLPQRRLTVDRDIEAFERDSFFDDEDLRLLNGERVSLDLASHQPSSSSSSREHDNASSSPCTYGLLGEETSAIDEEPPASLGFADLPVEVLERVFCFVPMPDLCLRLSSVCKLWHRIISKPDFIPWRKAYCRFRMTSLAEIAEELNRITQDKTETEDACLLDLVRNMPKFKARYSPVMDRDLQKHHLYALARDILKARAPSVWTEEMPNPWSTIALLAILSETVGDVRRIMDCLLHRAASCTTMEVLECLYCIAAYLWKYRLRFRLNGGLHYRVFHALHLFENSYSCIKVTPKNQTTAENASTSRLLPSRKHRFPCSFPPTHEQSRIISYDVPRGKAVKIVAFAGTGKTSTLVKYAERRPHVFFLYVAFNKSVKENAAEIFPKNVSSRTTHSLAFQAVGRKYKKKLQKSLSPIQIHHLLPPGDRKELPWLRYASLVRCTLDRYCASADDYITTQHVPTDYLQNMRERHSLDHRLRMKISNDATFVWYEMINVKNEDAHITHDVYLKLFQLSKPWSMNYDCLLIDEAQDLTPAQQDILLNQQCAKILVGDAHQQIYSFRGAVNSMDRIQSERTFYLTQSFRFGTEIAYIANCLLEMGCRNVAQMRQMLIGSSRPDSIDGRQRGRLAIITRSNVTLFNEAVRIIRSDTTTTLGFAAGIERQGMDVILDIYQLMQPSNKRGRIMSKLIGKHKCMSSLKTYSLETDNAEMMNKIKIVETHSVNLPELVEQIERRTRPASMADIVLSTAHAAKGLEFDTVKITDDFGINKALLSPLFVLERDELNMVYVAITRAKKSLVLNSSLMCFIRGLPCLEKFAYPVSGCSRTDEQDSPVVCTACKKAVPKNCPMLLKTKAIKTAYPTLTKPEGVLCPLCSVEFYPPYRCFFGESQLKE